MNPKNKKTVWRTYWIWQYEEEESWLNRMAAEGWALEEVHFFGYVFTRCQPGEYILRQEMLAGSPEKEENQEYIWFIRGTGVDYLGKRGRWVYFRKKAAEGAFELFSDLDSRLAHVKKVFWWTAIVFVLSVWDLWSTLDDFLLSLESGWKELAAFEILLLVLLAALIFWSGRGSWKLWKLRKKLKEERDLRE